ncbi:hypothetical protein PCL1606_32920 [Pseudomonas chlororaphis]|uniref:Uncharacterized protein n=1 Tax=Pseudomonas chlororaphis TaxID=587753 RepID=A0A0D5Y093_9PSED|nr:hypothetical protein PCL1606_32920 [Pseudomonas chlororaphis]
MTNPVGAKLARDGVRPGRPRRLHRGQASLLRIVSFVCERSVAAAEPRRGCDRGGRHSGEVLAKPVHAVCQEKQRGVASTFFLPRRPPPERPSRRTRVPRSVMREPGYRPRPNPRAAPSRKRAQSPRKPRCHLRANPCARALEHPRKVLKIKRFLPRFFPLSVTGNCEFLTHGLTHTTLSEQGRGSERHGVMQEPLTSVYTRRKEILHV